MIDEVRMYLRSKTDGYLFSYDEALLDNPDLEVVSEARAYPERHIPKHLEQKAKIAEEASEAGLDLSAGITEETGAEKEAETEPALAKQAAKGLPK